MEQWTTALDKLKHAYKVWDETKGKSIDTWMELFDYEVDLRSLAGGRPGVEWTENCISREGVRAYLEGLCSQFTMIHQTFEKFVCQGDTIVAIGSTAWRNNATGKVAESQKVDVWRIDNGKIVAFHEYYDTFALMQSTTA